MYLISFSVLVFAAFCASGSPPVLIGTAIVFAVWVFFVFGDRDTVVAILLMILVITVFAAPTLFLIKLVVEQSSAITSLVVTFIEQNEEFQKLIDSYLKWIRDNAKFWLALQLPPLDVNYLKSYLVDLIKLGSEHIIVIFGGAFNMVTNITNWFFALATYFTCFFYFIQMKDEIRDNLLELSPFTQRETENLLKTLKNSVISIFSCSLKVGVVRFGTTFLTFWLCGIETIIFPALVSGFLAMIPFLSSWVVWAPTTVGLVLAGRSLHGLIVGGVHLAVTMFVDPLIYNKTGNPFIVGTAIVMGLYAFGLIGVLLGPLIAALTDTVLIIYKGYVSKALQIKTTPS
eukprot:GILI01027920.1.p1 GENE.GILI01027920.1~~GILI01027920.1.p1  ORF type:complete len:344 (-),score=43.50 GILI01027920.1:84-1115(-)